MSPRAQAYRAKDGTITWHVRFRIDGAPNPVKETFGVYHPLVTVYPVLDAMLHMGNWDA